MVGPGNRYTATGKQLEFLVVLMAKERLLAGRRE